MLVPQMLICFTVVLVALVGSNI